MVTGALDIIKNRLLMTEKHDKLNISVPPDFYAAFMILRNRPLVKLDENENLTKIIDTYRNK